MVWMRKWFPWSIQEAKKLECIFSILKIIKTKLQVEHDIMTKTFINVSEREIRAINHDQETKRRN